MLLIRLEQGSNFEYNLGIVRSVLQKIGGQMTFAVFLDCVIENGGMTVVDQLDVLKNQ